MIQRVDVAAEAPADPWFVIWTESRAEKRVEQRLAAMGLEPWLPVVKERHRWSDRWREVECPLFPGYLFARVQHVEWGKILRTRGVLSVIKERERPALVADSVISGMRDAIGRDGAEPEEVTEPVDYSVGDQVVVREGVLAGVRGVVRERRSGRSLVIWVAEIGRGVAFTIGASLVEVSLSPNSPQATASSDASP